MNRQILNTIAVTVAFSAGAAVTALLLAMPVAVIPLYFGIAVLTGLVVDGLRLIAEKFWHRNRQVEHDIEDIFRSSLA